MTSDGGLFGTPRQDGPRPKLVVIGIVWAGFGVVALITAVLMSSVGFAVFGVLCVLAGGGLYAGQRARERLEEDERSWRSDPGGYVDDGPEPEPDLGPATDDGAPYDPDRHATRVMSSGDHDDIVDAEFYEADWEPSPSEQDDGTGYDDDETAYRRRREEEWAREERAREDEPRVIEADDDETDDRADDEPAGARRDDADHGDRDDDGTHGDRTGGTDGGPARGDTRDASR
ncbi:hypothetical protein [Actinomycetospora soli]|uniref:hypothetical protein n=1 Tax=Actinomycetospora soli TaxID=2893887 RepID=UPI001E441732|nr:hypothetical protein [Actinomycetospora soli]MCD2188637.1 hypothetical protein [Actinomycetospora soli]